MQTIFVLVKCALGQSYRLADQAVQQIDEVSEVHSISGQHDLLMKCCLTEGQDIGHFVTERLQGLTGVRETFTMIAFKAFT